MTSAIKANGERISLLHRRRPASRPHHPPRLLRTWIWPVSLVTGDSGSSRPWLRRFWIRPSTTPPSQDPVDDVHLINPASVHLRRSPPVHLHCHQIWSANPDPTARCTPSVVVEIWPHPSPATREELVVCRSVTREELAFHMSLSLVPDLLWCSTGSSLSSGYDR